MKKHVLITFLAVLALALTTSAVVGEDWSPNTLTQSEQAALIPQESSLSSATLSGSISAPGWVQPYQVKCSQRGALKVEICDCCIPGDHFEASARVWDTRPTTVMALATGSTSVYRGVFASSYGAKPLEALVNVRYRHGINVFGAGYTLKLTCLPLSSTLTYKALTQVPDTSR